MNDIIVNVCRVFEWVLLSFLALVWIYVAARMAARGVVRSLEEKEKEHGTEKEA